MTTQNESVQTELNSAALSQALTYRIYATREGLVGHTTANGHVIQPNDHFVALPFHRALSPNGSRQFSVQVRNPGTGLSEVAPVWDIGPWNTNDDYWNPSSQREGWRDLPQGMPEAQAAYQHGYNGGKDGSDRPVLNPAGIDLADGTFRHIGMTDNGFIEVAFLWTGHTSYTVVAYQRANVRNAPHLSGRVVSYVVAGESYPATCWTTGDTIKDNGITNNFWIKLPLKAGGLGYVSAVYLKGDKHANLPLSASC